MGNEHLVPADRFCTQHNVELSFISLLHQYGLIEITTVEQNQFISEECLPELERMIRLHYELDINLEGIEAIKHLLDRFENLQEELKGLKRKLRLYESGYE